MFSPGSQIFDLAPGDRCGRRRRFRLGARPRCRPRSGDRGAGSAFRGPRASARVGVPCDMSAARRSDVSSFRHWSLPREGVAVDIRTGGGRAMSRLSPSLGPSGHRTAPLRVERDVEITWWNRIDAPLTVCAMPRWTPPRRRSSPAEMSGPSEAARGARASTGDRARSSYRTRFRPAPPRQHAPRHGGQIPADRVSVTGLVARCAVRQWISGFGFFRCSEKATALASRTRCTILTSMSGTANRMAP